MDAESLSAEQFHNPTGSLTCQQLQKKQKQNNNRGQAVKYKAPLIIPDCWTWPAATALTPSAEKKKKKNERLFSRVCFHSMSKTCLYFAFYFHNGCFEWGSFLFIIPDLHK